MIARKGGDNFQLRFPDGLRERVRQRANVNGRSMNTEIIEAIEEHLNREDRLAVIERRLAKREDRLDLIERRQNEVERILTSLVVSSTGQSRR